MVIKPTITTTIVAMVAFLTYIFLLVEAASPINNTADKKAHNAAKNIPVNSEKTCNQESI